MTAEKHSVSTTDEVGGAVGVTKKWFIAIVNNNSERKCCERLTLKGYEAYIPIQHEIHHRQIGKCTTIDRIIFPSLLFVHVTEKERKEVVTFPFIHRFMSDRASKEDCFHRHLLATIPDSQMEALKFMLHNADSSVIISSTPLKIGDKIRVIRGPLLGLEGYIAICEEGKTYITICIDFLGMARVRVALQDIGRHS